MKGIGCFIFCLVLLISSCDQGDSISGSISLKNGQEWSPKVYLIQPQKLSDLAAPFRGELIDSAIIQKDGQFSFNKLPQRLKPGILVLAVQKLGERFYNRFDNEDLEQANYFPVAWKPGESIEITASITRFQESISINNPNGSNQAFLDLRDIRLKAFKEYIQGYNWADHDDSQLLEKEEARLQFQKRLITFAEKTEILSAAMLAVRWVSPENDYERVPEFLFSQCEKWQHLKSSDDWVSELCNKSKKQHLPVLKGDLFPDGELPMDSGDTTNLYSLMGSRLMLIDFWASWCAPCRKENKNVLVPIWEKYHKEGFEIIGYALDGNDDDWKKAIAKDGAYRWHHASHLGWDDAPLMEITRIQTIPANFLLDHSGKVIAKNIHGEDLMKMIDQFMEN